MFPILSVALIALAVGAISFKAKEQTKELAAKYWILKTGVNAADGDARINPDNYQLAGTSGVSCPSGISTLCQIFVEEDGMTGKPSIPNNSTVYEELYNDDASAPLAEPGVVFLRSN